MVLAYADKQNGADRYSLHPGKMMHKRLEGIILDNGHENPLTNYWQLLHTKGSFGQLNNKTWEYIRDFEQLPGQFSTHMPLED
jgi:hypothetical protein